MRNDLKFFLILSFLALPLLAFSQKRVTTNDGNALSPKREAKLALPPGLKVPEIWSHLLDPTQDEFWKEGNFTPDAGFLIWAKNPTIENAKLYLIRMNAKRNRIHTMQTQQEQANRELIELGIIANDYGFLSQQGLDLIDRNQSGDSSFDEIQIFFLFNPNCAHCKKQASILSDIPNVVPMQVGGSDLFNFPRLPRSVWAQKEDVQKYAPDGGVPVLLVHCLKTNRLVALKGVHSRDEILRAATKLSNKEIKNG